jgi:hypothetical protein
MLGQSRDGWNVSFLMHSCFNELLASYEELLDGVRHLLFSFLPTWLCSSVFIPQNECNAQRAEIRFFFEGGFQRPEFSM